MLMFGEVLTLRLSFGIVLILLAVMVVITSGTLQLREGLPVKLDTVE